MERENILRDRLIFLSNSICRMLNSATWTVYAYNGSINCLCGYEITYYDDADINDRIDLQITKILPYDQYKLECKSESGKKKNFTISLAFSEKEYVPIHEWVKEVENIA